MKKILLIVATSLFACKSKKEVPPYDISLLIPGAEPMCAYNLPAKYKLLYNPNTKEYVIGNSDSVIVAWVGDDGGVIKEPSYLGYNKMDYSYRWGLPASDNTRLAWAYRFKDSCAAKGALYRYFELQKQNQQSKRQKYIQDSITNVRKLKADSIKNDFRPVSGWIMVSTTDSTESFVISSGCLVPTIIKDGDTIQKGCPLDKNR